MLFSPTLLLVLFAAQDNLLKNPGFEAGIEGWRANASGVVAEVMEDGAVIEAYFGT